MGAEERLGGWFKRAGRCQVLKLDMRGLKAVSASLRGVDKQVRFAEMVAVNRAAFKGREAVQKEMPRVFDRPTSWVRGGVRVVKATKSDPVAAIDLDFWGNKQGVAVESILQPEIYGGSRKHKRHEIALQRAGILPAGMFIVPGAAANIDQYGNMSAGQINQIISWFQGFGEQGYQANMTKKTRDRRAKGTKKSRGFEYFVVGAGAVRSWARAGGGVGTHRMQPGIYLRTHTGFGSAIKPVMIFVRRVMYRSRLDFYGVGGAAARAEFGVQFPIAFRQAMASAK